MLPLRDENPTRRRAYVTLLLILVNVAVYFLWQPPATDPTSTAFEYEHAAIPCEITTREPISVLEANTDTCQADSSVPAAFPHKQVLLAILVSMFLHGSLVHLGGNMLFLWIFGNNVEDRLGPLRYFAFYVAAGVLATLAHVALQPHSTVPVIGASGAIAGVMGAYLIWYPNVRVLTWALFVLVRLRAKWLLLFWFFSQFFVNPNEGVAWGAHVGGFVFGALFALLTLLG
jgi:membrane associated rhomboid family serine protease